jgi:hypothetical protein
MRRVLNASVRGLVVVSIVMTMAVPAQAKPANPGDAIGRVKDRVVRFIRSMVVRTFGDGLSDPRP